MFTESIHFSQFYKSSFICNHLPPPTAASQLLCRDPGRLNGVSSVRMSGAGSLHATSFSPDPNPYQLGCLHQATLCPLDSCTLAKVPVPWLCCIQTPACFQSCPLHSQPTLTCGILDCTQHWAGAFNLPSPSSQHGTHPWSHREITSELLPRRASSCLQAYPKQQPPFPRSQGGN